MNENTVLVELPDLQNSFDDRNTPLYRVGVEEVKFPITVERKDGKFVSAQAIAGLYVNLPPHKKGVNMSRFIQCLMEYHDAILSPTTLKDIVVHLKERMESEDAYVRLGFDYFVTKPSPVTKIDAVESHPIQVIGFVNGDTKFHRVIRTTVYVQSLCPCSRDMAMVDAEKVIGKGAHNQRCSVRVDLYPTGEDKLPWFEDLIDAIEQHGSVPLYPLLKRPDEKWVTERAYENPKFVEDIARDTGLMLCQWMKEGNITGFDIKVTSEESIHQHNATAYFKAGHSPFQK